ncbi:MAG: hypothetical protein KDD11_08790 [Acidobacteria bacterium]|nr:hypothetical protein [Acidobacteriota bacterium]
MRIAVREALERELATLVTADFREWTGLATTASQDPKPSYHTEYDLWSEPKGG